MDTTTDSDPRARAPADPPDEGPTLTVIDGPNPTMVGVRRRIKPGRPLSLGRAPTSSFPGVFEGSSVSRHHARVGYEPSRQVVVTDLDSRNGTKVNGQLIDAPTALTEGDIVGLGDVLLLFHTAPVQVGVPRHPRLIGISAALANVLEQVALVAGRTTPVLVIGATGTGKELVAAEVHDRSGRTGQLVSLNCAGVADNLLASELFGHVRGAFTGADRDRKGLIETARGGTLFLDELTDASPSFQASLLRLFETGEYRRVGFDRAQTADVRFIAAVQPRVLDAVESGAFRLDLWTRLARWIITLPPLAERAEDVPVLARHFATIYGGEGVSISRDLMVALARFPWRGNVRELQGAIERLVVLSQGRGELDLQDWKKLDLAYAPTGAAAAAQHEAPQDRKPRASRPDRETLERALETSGGNVRATAQALGVTRKTLYRWLEALGVDVTGYRG